MNLISGIPAHILLVHFVVAGVPLAALVTVLSAVWPAARVRLGIVTPLIAFGALVTVVLAKNAGEWLQRHIPTSDLVSVHTRLGGQLLPFAAGLFVVAVAAWGLPWWAGRQATRSEGGATGTAGTTAVATSPLTSRAVQIAVAVAAVAFGLVATIQMVRIRDSGSAAAWKNGVVCKVDLVDNACPDGELIQP